MGCCQTPGSKQLHAFTHRTSVPMIHAVHRLLIILLIALLPLRSWAGELMGVQMATGSAAAQLASAAMPADCPMLSAADKDHAKPAQPGSECCASCELCTPMAELVSAMPEVVAFAAEAKLLMGRVDFQSAAPAPMLKPPIS